MIYGQKWKIQIDNSLPHGLAGQCQISKKTIALSKNQSREELIHTLIHEMGHALTFRVGTFQAISDEMIEVLVESNATMITEAFKLTFKK